MNNFAVKKSVAGTVMGLTLLGAGMAAQAATVTFSNILDGNLDPSLFDVSATVASGNTLTIGVNNFQADGGSTATLSALDTLSFQVTAPTGFMIKKVTYTENGSGETTGGVAFATGSITADGTPKNFLMQLFLPNTSESIWSIGGSVDIADKTSIIVSIVNSLSAVSFGGLTDIAQIAKTGASIDVEIAPIPLPPAVWMLGSALVGLATIRRRVA